MIKSKSTRISNKPTWLYCVTTEAAGIDLMLTKTQMVIIIVIIIFYYLSIYIVKKFTYYLSKLNSLIVKLMVGITGLMLHTNNF